MKFETLDAQQRADIFNNRTNTTITVDRKAVGIQGVSEMVPSAAFPSHVEIPPTPIALLDENAAQILVRSGDGPKGAWMRFFIMVYRNGGRVYFRDLDPNQLEAVIQFS